MELCRGERAEESPCEKEEVLREVCWVPSPESKEEKLWAQKERVKPD